MRSQKREEGSKQGKVRSDKKKREERREKREERSLQRSKKGSLLGGPHCFYTTPPGKNDCIFAGWKGSGRHNPL